MNFLKKSTLSAILIVGSLAVGSAHALTVSTPGVSSANLNVNVKNGVATIFGTADSAAERKLAEQFVAKSEGVDRVINLVTYN